MFAAGLALQTCDDATPVVPLADELAKAFCTHQISCCSPYELSEVTSDRYATETECLPYAALAAREQLGAIEGALAQGRISVDPAALDACVKAIANGPCNSSSMQQVYVPFVSAVPDLGTALKYCPNLFVGHVANNQPCNLTQECLAGSRCVGGPTQPMYGGYYPGIPTPVQLLPSPGLCIAYQKTGDPCNESTDCDPDHSCRAPDFVCGDQNKEGDPCAPKLDPLTGNVTSGCSADLGLFCDDIFTFTCRHLPRENEPCFNRPPFCDPDPALRLSCDGFSGICRRPSEKGQQCGGPAIPPCRDDLSCNPDPTQRDHIGTCGDVPVTGQQCTDRCASPALCSAGICTSPGPKPIGAECASSGECVSLSCGSIGTGKLICINVGFIPRCVGAGVTVGNVSGFGGMGGFAGTSGIAGSFGSGFAGSFVGGRSGGPDGGPAGSVGPMTGMGGGSGGAGGKVPPPIGCQFSDFPIGDPLIADFNGADGMPVIPIGGIYSYASPSGFGFPDTAVTNNALHFRATVLGMPMQSQYWGVGIFFNGNSFGTDCVDATSHTGIQFDISGSIAGTGCTAQYSVNDSAHTDNMLDSKGSGPPGSYSPQTALTVTASTATLMIPFTGTGAPTGGSPNIPIDKSRLTGVQWQIATALGADTMCEVDLTIDNVRFF